MNPDAIKTIIAYVSIVMAVLTQALSGIHVPPVASAVLGLFGVLLHPDTSVLSSVSTKANATDTTAVTEKSAP